MIDLGSFVYVASPYSHNNHKVEVQRYNITRQAVAWLINDGIPAYSPIVHCHELALHHAMPTDAASWQAYNEVFMKASAGIWVLCLPGWELSKGVAAELSFAVDHDIPVTYMTFNGNTLEFHNNAPKV